MSIYIDRTTDLILKNNDQQILALTPTPEQWKGKMQMRKPSAELVRSWAADSPESTITGLFAPKSVNGKTGPGRDGRSAWGAQPGTVLSATENDSHGLQSSLGGQSYNSKEVSSHKAQFLTSEGQRWLSVTDTVEPTGCSALV